jgi:DNA helicase-2/ATP-dependent DNA helicase PcrA
MIFNDEYKKLNDAQRIAVDAINGPVLVIAGPGTGKTQLLAMRVANILKLDSTLLPTNILCLTFTEAGQVAMQKRLMELMGEAGAHVAVHTFHSFCTEIINSYPDYFFNNAQFSPADELSTHQILTSVLDEMPHKKALTSQHEGDYVLIRAIKNRISELKKAAVSPEELLTIVKDNLQFVDYIEPKIIEVFGVGTFSKKDIQKVQKLYDYAVKYDQKQLKVKGFKPLSQVFIDTLKDALENSMPNNDTKPITLWKKDWYAKDEDKNSICKQRPVLQKLIELADVYQKYQEELNKHRLYDFDDMIMKVVHSLENRGDLLFDLQEQYQYILVDEFQDTNAGQMRLLNALADNPVNEQSPNIMAVGDDDQAIFAFQGAELSNLLGFTSRYPSSKQITITENYRSSKDILDASRAVIIQGEERLENQVNGINKALSPNAKFENAATERLEFKNQSNEYEYVADKIAQQISDGVSPNEIAIIAREHRHLESILPYLFDKNIPVNYERRQNALSNPKIKELITLAKVVNLICNNQLRATDELMPELLSADYWQLNSIDIWKLSLKCYSKRYENGIESIWINTMLDEKGAMSEIAQFLIDVAKSASNHSLEDILDMIIGNDSPYSADDSSNEDEGGKMKKIKHISPFKKYYFSDQILSKQPDSYIELLSSLTAIRTAVRSYKPDDQHSLNSFIEFCELANRANVPVQVRGITATSDVAVNLMTAHKSKGLEFDTVYILSAVQSTWDPKPRGGGISFSPNMYNIAHSSNNDDNLRLFYVAMTRAKRQLFISNYQFNEQGKEMVPYGALADENVEKSLPKPKDAVIMPDTPKSKLQRAERHWRDKHTIIPDATLKGLLQDRLTNYYLSATHLNNFLDVTEGGPQKFLLNNLLQFPSAMSPAASYGSAMHSTLEYIHCQVKKDKILPNIDQVNEFFSSSLKRKGLIDTDFNKFLERGLDSIKVQYTDRSAWFNPNQQPEEDFRRQGVLIGSARLTGKLDVIEANKKHITVTDYKTGKGIKNWDFKGKTAYDQIKTHRYKQQLLFYKLLIDGSRKWGDNGYRAELGELIFVEPDVKNKINTLGLELDNKDELERLIKLINAVWVRIMNLDFPDISEFSTDLKGIIQFEDWLINNQ